MCSEPSTIVPGRDGSLRRDESSCFEAAPTRVLGGIAPRPLAARGSGGGTRVGAVAALVMSCSACSAEPGTGLCDGNGGLQLDVVAFERFENVAIDDDDEVPVFVPPQGGVATELDIILEGVGFETANALQIDVADAATRASLATVDYRAGGLPLECVRDGALRVRAVPVPFIDTTPGALDARGATLNVAIERDDGAIAEFERRVVLVASAYE